MGKRSITNSNEIGTRRVRRTYDSSVRRAQTAETRERILVAASELAHQINRWDWRDLTINAIAKQAGVSERTVYRHFPNDRELHETLMRRLEAEAGVSWETLQLGNLPAAASRTFATLSSYPVPVRSYASRDPTFRASDLRRREAMLRIVTDGASDWSEAERRAATAMIDLLCTPLAYGRLIADWGFDADGATQAMTWALDVVVKAIRDGDRPNMKPPSKT